MNAPSTASKTAIVASFVFVRRSHRMTTLSRPADSKVHPSGAIDMHVTAVKCACRRNTGGNSFGINHIKQKSVDTNAHSIQQRNLGRRFWEGNKSQGLTACYVEEIRLALRVALHCWDTKSHTRISPSSAALITFSSCAWKSTRMTTPLRQNMSFTFTLPPQYTQGMPFRNHGMSTTQRSTLNDRQSIIHINGRHREQPHLCPLKTCVQKWPCRFHTLTHLSAAPVASNPPDSSTHICDTGALCPCTPASVNPACLTSGA
jgi:hypothetical protein